MRKDSKSVVGHAAVYLVARGVPGIIGFLAIPLFTRLLDPDGYGKYALVTTTVGLINALAFQWLRLAFVRYLPAAKDNAERLKATLLTCQLLMVAVAGAIVLVICLIPAAHAWRSVAAICWLVVAIQPMFELFCEQARATIQPWYYMGLQVGKSSLATGLGAVLIVMGLGWWGPLVGAAIGTFLTAVYAYRRDWTHTRLLIDRQLLITICKYGIPLSLTVALALVISSSDRYIIAYFLGDGAAGVYSVAVDFTSQTLTLLMNAISLAIIPLAIRAWEHEGREAARDQMRHNATLLLAVGVPSVVGLCMLAPSIAYCFLGAKFRAPAASIIPLIAIGTFLAGYKAYHLDSAFQFVHRTIYQVWIVLIAAVVNIALNLAVIRRFGINGAAAASVVAYLVSMVLTAAYGRRHFALPFPTRQFLQVLLASVLMAGVLYPMRGHRGAAALAAQLAAGMVVYGAVLSAFDFLDLRTFILHRLSNRRRRTPGPIVTAPLTPGM